MPPAAAVTAASMLAPLGACCTACCTCCCTCCFSLQHRAGRRVVRIGEAVEVQPTGLFNQDLAFDSIH